MNSRVILSALENVEMSSGYEFLVILFDPQFQKVLHVLLKSPSLCHHQWRLLYLQLLLEIMFFKMTMVCDQNHCL